MEQLSPSQIMRGMADSNKKLDDEITELQNLIEKSAEAEIHYEQRYAINIIEEKHAGVPVTLIDKIVRGKKEVADAKLKYLVAEGIIKACRLRINKLISAVDCYRTLLSYQKTLFKQTNIQDRYGGEK